MPACGLRHGSKGGPARPIFINTSSRPLRGAKPRGADDKELPQARPPQAGSRGAESSMHSLPHEAQLTGAIRPRPGGHQAGAGLRRVLVSSLVQRGQAQARVSRKGNHFGATRPRPAGRHDGGHRGAQAGITVRVFGRRGPTLVRISVLDVPLQNGQLLAPFPLSIWEEAQGLCL